MYDSKSRTTTNVVEGAVLGESGQISDDGRFVVFSSNDRRVVGDSRRYWEVLLWDRTSGRATALTQNSSSGWSRFAWEHLALSGDGNVIVTNFSGIASQWVRNG
jgi:hypothetical protein